MPVQINEVIVRAVVDPKKSESKGRDMDCPPSGNTGSEAELLEKVLEIIEEKRRR
jgi:hypothetical protein